MWPCQQGILESLIKWDVSMMTKNNMYDEVEKTICKLRNLKSINPDDNLFSIEVNCAPRDVAFIFFQLKERYGIDIEGAGSLVNNYTLTNIVDACWKSIPSVSQP